MDGQLRCCACGIWKPTDAFHSSRTGQFSYCRECRNAYDRRYYAERGRGPRRERHIAHRAREVEWLNAIKAALSCADCGQSFPPYAMHWDHLPGYTKVNEIGDLVGSFKRSVVLEELKKCELVCANCHAVRTSRRGRTFKQPA